MGQGLGEEGLGEDLREEDLSGEALGGGGLGGRMKEEDLNEAEDLRGRRAWGRPQGEEVQSLEGRKYLAGPAQQPGPRSRKGAVSLFMVAKL